MTRNSAGSGRGEERLSESDAIARLDQRIAAKRDWLAKCLFEVEAFKQQPRELAPFVDSWQIAADRTQRKLAWYLTLRDIVSDRDEWREQHENLLSVRQSDLRARQPQQAKD